MVLLIDGNSEHVAHTYREKTALNLIKTYEITDICISLRAHLFLKIPSYKSTMDEKAKKIGIFISTVWLWFNRVGWQSVWSLLVGQGKAIRHEIMVYKVLCSQCCQMALFGAKLEFFFSPNTSKFAARGSKILASLVVDPVGSKFRGSVTNFGLLKIEYSFIFNFLYVLNILFSCPSNLEISMLTILNEFKNYQKKMAWYDTSMVAKWSFFGKFLIILNILYVH